MLHSYFVLCFCTSGVVAMLSFLELSSLVLVDVWCFLAVNIAILVYTSNTCFKLNHLTQHLSACCTEDQGSKHELCNILLK